MSASKPYFPDMTLASGCWLGVRGTDFQIRPCKLTCPEYLAAIQMSRETGTPVQFRPEPAKRKGRS